MPSAIYDRLPEETDKAFQAFILYRDMGAQRTQEKVLEALGKTTGYLRQLQEWSGLYRWVERSAAYDAHIDTQARKVLEREAIKRRADMLKRHALLGKVLQQKSAAYLDKHGIDKSSDAISAAKIGTEMERKAEGLPEYMMEVVNADDSELARQYHALLAEIGLAGSGDAEAGDTDTGAPQSAAPSGGDNPSTG